MIQRKQWNDLMRRNLSCSIQRGEVLPLMLTLLKEIRRVDAAWLKVFGSEYRISVAEVLIPPRKINPFNVEFPSA